MTTLLNFIPSAVWIVEGLLLAYSIYRAISTEVSRPEFKHGDLVYQDHFGSGCSRKNWLTELGGANRCLWLIVSKDCLVVTAWFPYTLISWVYDLEHIIPFAAITKMDQSRCFGRRAAEIEYQRANGELRRLRLAARNMDTFVNAIARGRKVVTTDDDTLK
ncbi:hypothetical protein CCAX7_20070 [Capsulimonas corticalis]|uniref:Uncharacterized protein n=1 Tax=Capsulimonas corticalis TaxID=2219043 RepID=A0A402D2G4_9BACT|nr:hypothetical protein [Capsulimonas corticalis]BDI29956.1 hypothetical protein CCAX7_20070 [Capsulimonas corticalis]